MIRWGFMRQGVCRGVELPCQDRAMTTTDRLKGLLDALSPMRLDLLATYPSDSEVWLAFASRTDMIEDQAGWRGGR